MPAASASAAPEDYLFIIPDSGANLWGFNGLTTRCHCGRATRGFPPIFTALIDLGGLERHGQLINLVRASARRDLVGRSSKHLRKRSVHSSACSRGTHSVQEQCITSYFISSRSLVVIAKTCTSLYLTTYTSTDCNVTITVANCKHNSNCLCL